LAAGICSSARPIQVSQRCCIGLIRPPPSPTTATPPMVASTVISTGVVIAVAIPIWLSAAMMPRPQMNTDAIVPSSGP
jgi:hypothetical protein